MHLVSSPSIRLLLMLLPGKFQFSSPARQVLFIGRLLALLSLLLAAAKAKATAYYSSAPPTVATPAACGVPATCGGVAVGSAAQLQDFSLAANIYAAPAGPVVVRLPLSGTAPAGHRAGMLVSSLGSIASLQTLGGATLRTYLGNTLQETKLVDLTALRATLLASNGAPEQIEFTSTLPFDQVELELASTTSTGTGLMVQYAYGIGANLARQVTGYMSRFSNPAGQYSVANNKGLVCANDRVNNPQNATDGDLTNYATFSNLATVDCPGQLRVNLTGVSPARYQAGFVIGNGSNLLDANVLSGLALRTYLNGVPQEYATGASLLGLSLLPSGQGLVSFPTTLPFDAVAIERVGAVRALDNLQLYYGVGTAATPPSQVRSDWPSGTSHVRTSLNTLVCALCKVTNPQSAADGDLTNFAQVQVGVGVSNSVGLKVDLNGGGQAGNRAGMIIGRGAGDLLDAKALSRVTLTTYDAAGNVLETHSGAALLALAALPDGRQSISFSTTRDFASVGITIGGVVGALDTTNVYYAFADDSNGAVTLVAPAMPLPVQLVSLAVRRLTGTAEATLNWTTASELHSASFVVERSTNPAAGFIAVGQVAAAGSSTTTHQYSLRDAEAALLPGTLYYRLRQLDQDGTAVLSGVVVLAAQADGAAFSLYPNPGTATAPVLLSGSLPVGSTASVYSGQGQLLRQTATLPENQATLPLPTAGLAAGLYYIVLRDAAGQPLSTQRLQLAGQ